mmetsp:Transcript_5073/g.12274  ORF Transcript_5073/g.12274 Transcript_5073/m.12274 type:complete len:208 (-) Transcript_5073:1049-1672(-)
MEFLCVGQKVPPETHSTTTEQLFPREELEHHDKVLISECREDAVAFRVPEGYSMHPHNLIWSFAFAFLQVSEFFVINHICRCHFALLSSGARWSMLPRGVRRGDKIVAYFQQLLVYGTGLSKTTDRLDLLLANFEGNDMIVCREGVFEYKLWGVLEGLLLSRAFGRKVAKILEIAACKNRNRIHRFHGIHNIQVHLLLRFPKPETFP